MSTASRYGPAAVDGLAFARFLALALSQSGYQVARREPDLGSSIQICLCGLLRLAATPSPSGLDLAVDPVCMANSLFFFLLLAVCSTSCRIADQHVMG